MLVLSFKANQRKFYHFIFTGKNSGFVTQTYLYALATDIASVNNKVSVDLNLFHWVDFVDPVL